MRRRSTKSKKRSLRIAPTCAAVEAKLLGNRIGNSCSSYFLVRFVLLSSRVPHTLACQHFVYLVPRLILRLFCFPVSQSDPRICISRGCRIRTDTGCTAGVVEQKERFNVKRTHAHVNVCLVLKKKGKCQKQIHSFIEPIRYILKRSKIRTP